MDLLTYGERVCRRMSLAAPNEILGAEKKCRIRSMVLHAFGKAN